MRREAVRSAAGPQGNARRGAWLQRAMHGEGHGRKKTL